MKRGKVAALRGAGLAVGVVLTAGLASGCASAAGDRVTAPGASASGASATHGTVTIGILGAFSGTFASIQGGAPKVLNAWAASVNASGGLAGRSVQVISKDTAVGIEPGLVRQSPVAS